MPPGKLQRCPSSPNCVSSWPGEDEKHRVPPLRWPATLADTKAKLRRAVLSAGNAKFVEETETYWHVEFRSRFFRFVDDVEFLFDPQGEIIHVRSASRVGYSDLGVNRARVEKIRRVLNG
jgi:uncharacterized protein (DUF1499 family)